MYYLTLNELLELHHRVIRQSGGAMGIHSLGALESALAQPRMTFAGKELYPTVIGKAATLGFSLVNNHPFVDGNKRTGHAAMEIFLILNELEIDATVDEQERTIFSLAAGELSRKAFTAWLHTHTTKRKN